MEVGEEVEESKWQDRIAFRFDQIVSFASTAMEDKRRRSTEEGASCNTSPDSGIGHGDPPLPNIAIGSQKHLPDPLTCISPSKSTRSFKSPTIKSSPTLESPPIEAPIELPPPIRTPSPANLPALSPPVPLSSTVAPQSGSTPQAPLKYQRQEKLPHAHHFKKKFFHREQWGGWQVDTLHRHQKKFRPKGKDWDWSANNPGAPAWITQSEWDHRPPI